MKWPNFLMAKLLTNIIVNENMEERKEIEGWMGEWHEMPKRG
jgi:hypothetical protein